jgi:integration host factor subunit beta
MTKQDLIDRLARGKNELFKAESKKIVELTFQEMSDALADGDRIEIRGLGTFEVRNYLAYAGRNPKTGKRVEVKPKKLPFFKVGKELKERVDFK